MKRTTKLVIALWAMFVAPSAFSQKGPEQQLEKDANTLFAKGEYLQAFPMYSQLVSLYPNHPDYNYKFGACAIYSEADKSKAIKFLNIATTKNVEDVMAWYYLGKAYHLNYQFRESIQAYEAFLRKADPKVAAKTDAQREIETCIYGSNLLANIKDVQVINKTEADRNSFFRYFNLESIGGKILTLPDELKTKLDEKATEPGVIHYPGNSTTIYFSSYGKDGKNGKDIYRAQMLPDGKFSTPEMLKGDVNTRYDEDYCFMHSDGKTLYFASKGHNSMGGYDIFKSVYDPSTDSFGPAINLDFAINTPDDDIFFIADSLNQRAYFASARTSDQKHLHVYNVMVQSNPLQIIYLKGEFISDINPEQHKAAVKINDQMSGRVVMEGSTNQTNGSYVLYVPGAGEYSFKVITENSATVHDVKVNIPSFNKPVALRQEMRLISDGGKDKLIVTNYFEEPLNEDLAALAADMLRKKAGLDVNVDPNQLSTPSAPVANNAAALEKNIDNAALAAGYADGVTIGSIIGGMEAEVATIKTFVKESDQKYINGYAYARKKQLEAEANLAQAEKIRANTKSFNTQEDVNQLRKSVELTDKAKELQREASAAMAAAETVKAFKDAEATRVAALEDQVRFLQQAQTTSNYDAAVQALSTERQRQSELRAGNTNNPSDQLTARIKAKESEQQKAEQDLVSMRDEEKELNTKLNIAEAEKNNAKKKADKEKAEENYVLVKSSLDKIRRDIAAQQVKLAGMSEGVKDSYANVAVYNRLAKETSMGLSASEQVAMTETDRQALEMKLKDIDSRADALEINDPAMLALITDAGSGDQMASNRTSGSSAPSTIRTRDALSIASDHDALMAKAGTAPANASTRRMYISSGLTETNTGIAALEIKKKNGTLTAQDETDLKGLVDLRGKLQAELAANANPAANFSDDEIRAVYAEITPDYNERILAINNDKGNEIEHALQVMNLKEETLEKLRTARYNNAMMAAVETDPATIQAMSARDDRYDLAIRQLESRIADVSAFRAAYESENKAIIESNDPYPTKIQNQMEIAESYLDVLEELEEKKQARLDMTTDMKEADALRTQLAEIRAEQKSTETKLDTYRTDISLTAATSEPKADSTRVALNVTPANTIANPESAAVSTAVMTTTPAVGTNLEEVIEKSNQEFNFNSPNNAEGDPQKSQAQKDTEIVEKLYKKREQSESIFAYESGSFEEIVAQHTSPATELKHRDKIQEINDEIFLVEAEMENEKSESKLRKLDYRAEQLYLRRSLIEIDNATAIATMAQQEYEEESTKANEAMTANQEKIDSRQSIRDFVDQLERQAKSNVQEAATLREIAPSKMDDIERADYYREAFAKEALAIEQMKQIQGICNNIDMMLTYDEAQIEAMKAGKSPDADLLASQAAADAAAKQAADEAATKQAADDAAAKLAAEELAAAEAAKQAEATKQAEEAAAMKAAADAQQVADAAAKTAAQNEAAAAAKKAEADRIAAAAKAESERVAAATAAAKAAEASSKNASASNPSAATPKADARPAGSESYGASASAGAYSAAEAENYYFSAPDRLEKDLFVRTTRAVYSESKPIPINMELPKGVYYRVQVGAFRNDIPQNLYDEFAPMSGETLSNGITRYSAGFFTSFDSADQTKREIRNMGYADAFVVAYRDGKRIPLYEAMGQTDKDFQANVEKEYVYGDKGTAPKSNVTSAPATTETAGGMTKTNYYSGYPDAAKATQVETVKGLFFTVQVGVYSRPVPPKSVYYINPLNTELTDSQKIRYTSGRYKSMADAVDKRAEAKALGIKDAFITAYYNGKKITLTEADRLLKENGPSILAE